MKLGILTFSKDRPCQLYSHLSSLNDMVKGDYTHSVLIKNNPIYNKAYQQIMIKFNDVIFVIENNFKSQVIELLEFMGCDYIMMAADDSIFVNEFDVDDVCGYSNEYVMTLRLGKSISTQYTTGGDKFKIPEFTKQGNKNKWTWKDEYGEWRYPVAVDATIFQTEELIRLLKLVDFQTPNTLEGNLNSNYGYKFMARYGLCYDKSVYINTPWNLVSSQSNTKHANISPEFFQEQWDLGNRINHEKFYGMDATDCHMELDLEFVKR